MNSLKEWWENKKGYPKVPVIIVFYLLIFIVIFLYVKSVFLSFLLVTILTLFIIIPILYSLLLIKQPITSEEYYFKTIKTNYMCMDESLLIKMFEIRINNTKQFVFAYLLLIMTFTLTMAFNPEARNYFEKTILGVSSSTIFAVLGGIGILALVFYSFGIDRLTLQELRILCKAKEKLKQLKKHNIPSPIKENANSIHQDKTPTIKSSIDIIALVEDALENKDTSVIEKIKDKNHLKYMQKVVEVAIIGKGLIFSSLSVYIGAKGISLCIIAIGVSFFLVGISMDNLSKITYPLTGAFIVGLGMWQGIKTDKRKREFEKIERDIEFMHAFILKIEEKLLK